MNNKNNLIIDIGQYSIKVTYKSAVKIYKLANIDDTLSDQLDILSQIISTISELNRNRLTITILINTNINFKFKKELLNKISKYNFKQVNFENSVKFNSNQCELPITSNLHSSSLQIGHSLTELAIFKSNEIVSVKKFSLSGKDFDNSILNYCKESLKIIPNLEDINLLKNKYSSAIKVLDNSKIKISGKNLKADGIIYKVVDQNFIYNAIRPNLDELAFDIKKYLESLDGKIYKELKKNGILLLGGTSEMQNIDEYLSKVVGVLFFKL